MGDPSVLFWLGAFVVIAFVDLVAIMNLAQRQESEYPADVGTGHRAVAGNRFGHLGICRPTRHAKTTHFPGTK